MKICVFGDANSIHIKKRVRYLVDKSHQVYLFSYRERSSTNASTLNQSRLCRDCSGQAGNPTPFDEKIQGVKIYLIKDLPVHIPFLSVLYKSWKIKKILSIIKPDIIHAHFLSNYGWLGANLKFKPFIVTSHGSDMLLFPEKSFFNRLIIKYVLKKADFIICVSRHILDTVLQFKIPANKSAYIPSGIDTKLFYPILKEKKEPKQFCIISTRSLDPFYRVDVLIKAVSVLLDKKLNFKVMIIGDGSDRKNLEKLVHDLKVKDHVEFTGRVPNQVLPEYLRLADIYVSTTSSDGMPVSLLEAMACGNFPIVTNFSGYREIIKDGENGFFYCFNNEYDLADKIMDAYNNNKLRESAIKKNSELIQKAYVFNDVMADEEALYHKLTG